jgi:hypothetical protein
MGPWSEVHWKVAEGTLTFFPGIDWDMSVCFHGIIEQNQSKEIAGKRK